MHDFYKLSDPDANSHFRRCWEDDPLSLPEVQHLGREIAPRVVEDVARQAIGRWFNKASEVQARQAAEAFRQADAIRRKMGLAWEDLIEQRSAA